ncbi:hypothetical protein BDN70DRAFT_990271, partial [Pholiota conissans]
MPPPTISKMPLPVEVLDHIFSFMRTDIPSLTVCMSVNPSFQAIGEKHLWHHYTLHNCHSVFPQKQPSGTPEQLAKILADAPHLATYIRSLGITIAAPSILQWFMARSLNVDEMAPLLEMLSHLEQVSMVGRQVSWEKLDHAFRASLVRTLRLPSLEEITIEGMDHVPLSIFDGCPALKRLSFVGCHFAPTPDRSLEPPQIGTRPSLESFVIQNAHASLQTVKDWLHDDALSPDIANLRSLNIRVDSVAQLFHVVDLLQICSDSLREFELVPSDAVNLQYDVQEGHSLIPLEYDTPPLLNLSSMHALRSLTIDGEIWTSDGFWVSSDGEEALGKNTYSTPFAWICNILESPPPLLTHLTLDILFKVAYPSNLRWICFKELAQALSSPHLKDLRHVEMLVSLQTTGNVSRVMEVALTTFRRDAHLSDLIRRGLLVVRSRTKKDGIAVRL